MNRKTIILIFTLTISLVAVILFCFISISTITQSVNKTIEFKPTIIIDPGHGGEDGGATVNNILEKNINLSIAIKLKDIFESNGFSVIMTRDTDSDLSDNNTNKKFSDLNKRVSIFNSSLNNIVISIHQNKFTNSKYRGAQVFYSDNNENSKTFAECISMSINNLLQPYNNRQTKLAGSEIFILDKTDVPAVLVECGFLSNAEDISLVTDENYQTKLAFTIYLGFLDYYYKNY